MKIVWKDLLIFTAALFSAALLAFVQGYDAGVQSQLLSAEEVKEWHKQYTRDIVSTCVAIENAKDE